MGSAMKMPAALLWSSLPGSVLGPLCAATYLFISPWLTEQWVQCGYDVIAPLVRILTDLVLVALVSRYLRVERLKRLARASAHTPSAQTDSAAVSDESRREACVCEADASHTSLKHHPLEVG